MPSERSVKLSEQDQERLVRAIESAIEVSETDEFHAWMRGPFRALLPHESVVCIELSDRGHARPVDCLHHTLVDAATTDFLCHPERGLAVRLARSYPGRTQISCMMNADAINALLEADRRPADPHPLHNAVIHRTRFLSGAGYFFVLVNVPQDQIDRCLHLFKLLSSHLKMALSRAIAPPARKPAAALTRRELEIVQLMSDGKSNREISVALAISPVTLKSHISKIYRKLDVQNRAEAVLQGMRLRAATESGPP
jgi:DNA-binding CsgD family transcriptional regulator